MTEAAVPDPSDAPHAERYRAQLDVLRAAIAGRGHDPDRDLFAGGPNLTAVADQWRRISFAKHVGREAPPTTEQIPGPTFLQVA